MSRRSDHSREELKDLIISSSRKIIEEKGYEKFSARQVADEINYSAGTIYNIFLNLNELILYVEIEVLKDIEHKLTESFVEGEPRDQLHAFALEYYKFTIEDHHLWELIMGRRNRSSDDIPPHYRDGILKIIQIIDKIISKLVNNDDALTEKYAHLFWKGLNGVILLSDTHKCALSNECQTSAEVAFWVDTFITSIEP